MKQNINRETFLSTRFSLLYQLIFLINSPHEIFMKNNPNIFIENLILNFHSVTKARLVVDSETVAAKPVDLITILKTIFLF